MPKKTLEQEIQELISRVQPHWHEPIVYDADAVRAKSKPAITVKTRSRSKPQPKPVYKPEPKPKEIEGMELVRFNRGGKTAVVILDKKVQVIFRFPGKQELTDFLAWFD